MERRVSLTGQDETDLLVALKVGSVKNEDGREIGVFGIAQDLLGQNQARQDLHRSEEQFRQWADHVREVFLILSPALKQMTYISPACDEIWGRSRQERYDRPVAWSLARGHRAGSGYAVGAVKSEKCGLNCRLSGSRFLGKHPATC